MRRRSAEKFGEVCDRGIVPEAKSIFGNLIRMKSIFEKYGILPFVLALLSFALSFVFEKALIPQTSLFGDLLRGSVVAIITYLIVVNIETFRKILNLIGEKDLDRIANIREHIDREFLEIFDDYFDSLITNVNSAIEHKRITIHPIGQFRDFYIRVLSKCPNTTFYATSLIDKDYFWDDTIKKGSVEHATKEFTDKGGLFERIFIITDDNKKDLDRMRNVFEIQKKIGVTTYCIEAEELGIDQRRLKKFILVTKNRKFAWEVHVDHDGKISSVDITVDRKETKRFLEKFNEFKKKDLKTADEYMRLLTSDQVQV